jgi:hypothetical protein
MGTFLRLALPCLAAVLIQSANAASAVAWGGHGHLATVTAYSLKEAKRRAIDLCRRKGGIDIKILAASDVVGYGTIAVARLGTGSVIGVSVGRRSATESEIRAKKACLRAGGTNPKVRWGWYG